MRWLVRNRKAFFLTDRQLTCISRLSCAFHPIVERAGRRDKNLEVGNRLDVLQEAYEQMKIQLDELK